MLIGTYLCQQPALELKEPPRVVSYFASSVAKLEAVVLFEGQFIEVGEVALSESFDIQNWIAFWVEFSLHRLSSFRCGKVLLLRDFTETMQLLSEQVEEYPGAER